MKKGYKARYEKIYDMILTAVLNIYIPDSKLNIRLPQRKKKISTVLSDAQIAILLKGIENTEIEILVLLALWLGLRQSEICGLSWNCVDFDNKFIIIKQAKVRDKNKNIVLKTTKTYSSTRKIKTPQFILEKK